MQLGLFRNIIQRLHFYGYTKLDVHIKKGDHSFADLDKLIYTMKEAHNIALNSPAPAFMKESWIASALEELDTRGLSPERRADLRIALAKELSERYRLEHSPKRLFFQHFHPFFSRVAPLHFFKNDKNAEKISRF